MKVHKSITQERILEAVKESHFGLEDRGFCISCGEDAYNVEPDARRYPCESCGERTVYGAEELMLHAIA